MTEENSKALEFLAAQEEAEKEGRHEFRCPICGGTAEWSRSKYNGHLKAWCRKCILLVME